MQIVDRSGRRGRSRPKETRHKIPSAPALVREARGLVCFARVEKLQGHGSGVTDECRDISAQKKEKHV